MHIVVIGAGIAGLSAARRLRDRGHAVCLLDKGRRPGGRVCTRRAVDEDADSPDLRLTSYDHGAQYFTVRDPRFDIEVRDWQGAGIVREWRGALATFDNEGREALEDGRTRWVGVPGMSAIPGRLATGLDVRTQTRVVGLSRLIDGEDRSWCADTSAGGAVGPFDAAVVAVPAAQAVPLVATSARLAAAAAGVVMHPCWTTAATFEARLPTRFDAAFVSHSALGWVARDNSKPRRGPAETWILQATGTWSRAHFDDQPGSVSAFLIGAFADLLTAPLPAPVHVFERRWSLACADPPLAVGALVDPEQRLVMCGDWCAGNRIEDAWLSGLAAADALDALP